MKRLMQIMLIGSLLIENLLMSGCSNHDIETLKIAEQYGLAYAPIQIMKEKGLLETALPGVTIEWEQLGNTTAIREAMLSDYLDVGFLGIPPFLIGYDNGMPWKIMTGLTVSPLGLVTNDSTIQSLNDLQDNGKIALPQPGSIQHILLAMAAEGELGEADLFDNQLIAMNHPDGYQALVSNTEVVAHFTSPPYLFQEMDIEGNQVILTGEEAMGEPFSFIVGVCTEDFYQKEDYYEGVLIAVSEAIRFIDEEREETIQILAQAYDLDEATVEDYLYNRGIDYTQEILGVEPFIEFMTNNDYLTKEIQAKDVIY
jgi:NitT/TauT family transport system substrate-binding protein